MLTRRTRRPETLAVIVISVVTSCNAGYGQSPPPDVSLCSSDMVRVTGDALSSSNDLGEALQDMACIEWINKDFPEKCRVFDRSRWLVLSTKLRRKPMDFCIDRYEWPNVTGRQPEVFVNYYEAQAVCRSVGKRLCDEEEWTFACEGEEGLPYPYGYVRDERICNIDKPWIPPDNDKLFSLQQRDARTGELKRLWQGEPLGDRERCVSPFGVHDMTGNVDEITTSTRKSGHRSIMKGGYWSVVRDRCRVSTRIHNEWHKYYQLGFRCCAALKNPRD